MFEGLQKCASNRSYFWSILKDFRALALDFSSVNSSFIKIGGNHAADFIAKQAFISPNCTWLDDGSIGLGSVLPSNCLSTLAP